MNSESTRTLPGLRPTGLAAPEVFPTGLTVEEAQFGADGDVQPPFRASRFTVAPGGRTPPDTHDVAECWFVASGEGRLLYDSEELTLRQGDMIVFTPKRTHQVFNESDQPLTVFSTWWDVDGRR